MRNPAYRLIALLILLFWGIGYVRAIDQELLDMIRTKHVASRELVSRMSCEVERTITFSSSETPPYHCTSVYWHTPEAVRVREKMHERTMDFVWKPGGRKSLGTTTDKGKKKAFGSTDSIHFPYTSHCDPWRCALLVLPEAGTGEMVTFEEFLRRAERVTSVERKNVNGTSMVSVRLAFAATGMMRPYAEDVELEFDPTVNYFIRKAVHSSSHHRMELNVVHFQECAPGVFFPTHRHGRIWAEGKEHSVDELKIKNIRINPKFSPGAFDLKFPHGTHVADDAKKVIYDSDSEGRPISPPKPFLKRMPPQVNTDLPLEYRSETTVEPEPMTRWLLPTSLAFFVVAFVIWKVRKVHAAN